MSLFMYGRILIKAALSSARPAKWTHGLILDRQRCTMYKITRTPLHLDRIYLASLHLPIASWKGAWMCLYAGPCTCSLQVPPQSDDRHAVQDIWDTWTIKTNLPPL